MLMVDKLSTVSVNIIYQYMKLQMLWILDLEYHKSLLQFLRKMLFSLDLSIFYNSVIGIELLSSQKI